MNKPEQYAQKV